MVRVEGISSSTERFADVLRLYRENSQTLGFMPQGAFEQRANRGTLLVAVDTDGATVGYVLYDLPGSLITLRHLCVSSASRGQGVARALIEELKRRHPERLGIKADCRSDYPAHKMWPELDFEAVTESRGRSREGLPLTSWWLDFGHPSLFTLDRGDEPRVRIAIDADVFIDLFEDRPGSDESRRLVTDWVVDVAELVITKSVLNDIANSDDSTVRASRRADASRFPRADCQEAEWRKAEARLLAAVGDRHLSDHDRRDVQHVARAAGAEVGTFATRDKDLVRMLRGPAWELFGLRVGLPGDLLTELWAQIAEPYSPVLLENTQVRLERPTGDRDGQLVDHFLNSRSGERRSAFARLLRSCRAEPERLEVCVVASHDDVPMALFARATLSPRIEVPILRVTARPGAPTIARHVAHLLRSSSTATDTLVVEVTDPMLSVQVPDALEAEGYVSSGGQWWALAVDVHAPPAALAGHLERVSGLPDSLEVDRAIVRLRSNDLPAGAIAEIEHRFAPARVASACLPTFLVPIKASWAEELFDTDLSKDKLFGRRADLALTREHVYYSAAPRGSLGPPARLLWYVSKDGQRSGTGAVRAVSRLEEVAVGRPLDLHRRFGRLGVYREEQVLSMARRSGKLMALRYTDTELFGTPVRLAELRALAQQCGRKLVLQSPQPLPEHLFDRLYAKGRGTYALD